MDADTPDTPGTADTRSTRDPIEALLDEQAKERFPDGSVSRAELLRYGDDPRIEPGKLLVRVHVKTPAQSGDDPMDDWEHAHQTATRQLHDELTRKVPEVTALEFVMETAGGRYPNPNEVALVEEPGIVPLLPRLMKHEDDLANQHINPCLNPDQEGAPDQRGTG